MHDGGEVTLLSLLTSHHSYLFFSHISLFLNFWPWLSDDSEYNEDNDNEDNDNEDSDNEDNNNEDNDNENNDNEDNNKDNDNEDNNNDIRDV